MKKIFNNTRIYYYNNKKKINKFYHFNQHLIKFEI